MNFESTLTLLILRSTYVKLIICFIFLKWFETTLKIKYLQQEIISLMLYIISLLQINYALQTALYFVLLIKIMTEANQRCVQLTFTGAGGIPRMVFAQKLIQMAYIIIRIHQKKPEFSGLVLAAPLTILLKKFE